MLQEVIDALTRQRERQRLGEAVYKGTMVVAGRKSATDSLFDATIATFENDAGSTIKKTPADSLSLMRCARASRVLRKP